MLVVLFGMFSHADAATLKASTLRVGSTGETVKAVQQKLSDLGYEISVDGKFGKGTSSAVAKFQASKNLKPDGLCGEKTLALVLGSKVSTDASVIALSNSATKGDGIAKSPITDDIVWARTCSDGKPHIKILSPNGGEVYEAGQKITINWKSCNVPWLHNLKIQTTDSDVLTNSSLIMGAGVYNNSPITNDNNGFHTAELDLPSAQWINDYHMAFGKRFKISISSDGNVAPYNFNVSDLSDDTFTINNKQTVDVCANITGIQTTVPAGMFVADGNCYSSQPVDPVCSAKDSFIKVVSPNGGETYQAGQQTTVKWKSCNAGNNLAILLEHYNANNVLDGGINSTPSNTINDGSEVITLPASIQNPNSRYKIVITDQRVIPGSTESMHDYSDNFFTINGSVQPKVQIGTSATTPPTSTVTASQTQITSGVRLLGFTVKAIDGNVTLKKVPVQINSTGSSIQNIVSQLKLVDASGNSLQTADTIGNYISSGAISASTGCTVKDCGYFFANFGNITIPSGTTKEFSIMADIRPITTSTGDATRTLKVSLVNNDVVSSANLGVVDQNGDTITSNNTYRIGSAIGNVITFNTNGSTTTTTTTGTTTSGSFYAPDVTTLNPIFVNQSSINFDGYYNMNGCSGTTYFEYGTTRDVRSKTASMSRTGSGSMQQSIQGLSGGTIYYYRAVVQNCMGTSRGDIKSAVTSGIIKQPMTTASF